MAEHIYTQCTVGGPVFVHVEDGVIKKVRPLVFNENDSPSWSIKAKNGQIFTPPRKALINHYVLTEKPRIYSENRIKYPYKRADFDPKGNRKPENRGKSGYQEISWDEALDILTDEIKRIQFNYGPGAIASTPSSHHNWGNIGYRHSTYFRFMNILGYTYVDHNPDSWEGWHWGAMHNWGFAWRLGIPEQPGRPPQLPELAAARLAPAARQEWGQALCGQRAEGSSANLDHERAHLWAEPEAGGSACGAHHDPYGERRLRLVHRPGELAGGRGEEATRGNLRLRWRASLGTQWARTGTQARFGPREEKAPSG